MNRSRFQRVAGLIPIWCWIAVLLSVAQPAVSYAQQEPRTVRIDDPLPFGQSPISYHNAETNDVIDILKKQVDSGAIDLEFDPKHGYLPAVLKALDVPQSSQLLVFSKTALNPKLVSPKNPRAIFFNDEVSVALVPGAAELELTAVDPLKGSMFYVLSQRKAKQPEIKRNGRCLACHVGTTTMRVPGLMARSFFTNKDGKPVSGYSRITHDAPLWKRWGGWYVTGQHGKRPHRGNLIGAHMAEQFQASPLAGGNVDQLSDEFDVANYLQPTSDIVAHLLFEHQIHGLNLIYRVNYEARFNRHSDAKQRLLRYLLFADEPPLDSTSVNISKSDRNPDVSKISGNNFATWFEKQAAFDKQGRSLRQFDLRTRLFTHRLSYLIYHRAYVGLPTDVRLVLNKQLRASLSSRKLDESLTKHIPLKERDEILAILADTQPSYFYAEPN